MQDYFAIQVLDSQTGRGFRWLNCAPIIKTITPTAMASGVQRAGPDESKRHVLLFRAMDTRAAVWPLQTTPGNERNCHINRLQRAERLYRVTGKGIYQDTVLLGQSAPIDHPLFNANVKGQDSVQTAIYNGQIHWFWGDTLYEVGFGNFRASGATSQLPGQGGLDPPVGVNLDYYVDAGMAPRSK